MKFWKSKRRERILHTWDDLSDALVAFRDARIDGATAQLRIAWKAEKRHQDIHIRVAPVEDLGFVAFLEAPLGLAARRDLLHSCLHEVCKFLVGGIVVNDDEILLRACVPFENTAYSEFDRLLESLASCADSLKLELDGSNVG